MELAAAVVAVLSPYLAQAAGGIAAKAGEGVAVLVGDLYALVRRRFDDDPDPEARGALRELEAQPADGASQQALVDVLAGKATADPEFAEQLTEALEKITNGRPVNQQFLTQVFGGEVGKIVNIGQVGEVHFG